MVGRAAACTVEQIYEVLKTKKIYNSDGKLIKKSDKLWKSASNRLGNLNHATLYFYVHGNWGGLKDKLIEYYSKDESFEETLWKINNPNAISKCKLLNDLSIQFDEIEWQALIGQRNSDKLATEWTHTIFAKLYDTYKLPCAFSFKKGYKFKKNEDIMFEASCNECGNYLKGFHSSLSEQFDFDIVTYDSTNIRHFAKRHLSGELRRKHQEELKHVKPLRYQRYLAKTYSKFGEVPGPLVYSSPVLRKARQSGIYRLQGISSGKNVIDELIKMKLQPQWNEVIKMIGEFPFHIVFYTKEQIELWKYISSNIDDLSLSMDAAGRFIKKIKTSGIDTTSHIFLYVISTSIGGKIYPLFQFVSEYQAANFLKYLLDEWKNAGAPPVKQIVVDGSSALQSVISLCYNSCSFKEYLQWCHEVVKGERIDMPPCYIRADIAHLIKSITRWKCFEKCSAQTKDFYLRIIGFLSGVSDYEAFLEVVKNVFLVCQSPGASSKKVKDAITKLEDCIKFYTIEYCTEDCSCDTCAEEIIDNKYNDEESKVEEESSQESNTLPEEMKKLQLNSFKEICEGPDVNMYYCNELLKNISLLFTEYALWTNVLLNKFGSNIEVATSGRSEALFSDLRNISFMHRPVTCQLFISQYINDYLIGALNIAMGFLKNSTLMSPKLPAYEKNKKTKSKVEPLKKRGTYVQNCLDLKERQSRPKMKRINILKNANLESPIVYNSETYIFQSSCMFDSLFELCSSSYNTYNYCKTLFEGCKTHNCIIQSIIDYVENADEKSLRLSRLRLCLDHFELNQGTLHPAICMYNFIKQIFCNCFQNNYCLKLLKQNSSEILNISKIDTYIKHALGQKNTVEWCVFIDLSEFCQKKEINLNLLPVRIVICKEHYLLTGAIAYKESLFDKKQKHYYAYCRSIKNAWLMKDDQAKSVLLAPASTLENVKVAIIMYVKTFN